MPLCLSTQRVTVGGQRRSFFTTRPLPPRHAASVKTKVETQRWISRDTHSELARRGRRRRTEGVRTVEGSNRPPAMDPASAAPGMLRQEALQVSHVDAALSHGSADVAHHRDVFDLVDGHHVAEADVAHAQLVQVRDA